MQHCERKGGAALNSRATVWTAGVIVISLLLIAASHWGALDPVENAVSTVVSPLQRGLRNATNPVADWLSNLTELNGLSDENKALRTENERLQDEVARLRESEIKLQEMEKLLQVEQTFPDQEFLATNILAKDPSNLKEVVAIDRGKRDGVREGMVVVTEGHSLVGTVTSVHDSYAWVTLITDPNSAVSAMVQESRAQGVVTGSYSRQLSIEFVAQGAVVKEGDAVITSAIGGHYPAGLVIGKVTAVQSTPQELFKKVSVEPLASLAHLEMVLVLTSFVPLDLEAP
jgi:rod shape-determining protein MreC